MSKELYQNRDFDPLPNTEVGVIITPLLTVLFRTIVFVRHIYNFSYYYVSGVLRLHLPIIILSALVWLVCINGWLTRSP
jgi:hypothetical protein